MSQDLHLEYTIAAPMQAVYLALTTHKGISGWWTRDAEVGSHPGEELLLRFPGVGIEFRMGIVELTPFSRVHWHCLRSTQPDDSAMAGDGGWQDTEPVFTLVPEEGFETRLVLSHSGMTPARGAYAVTLEGWQHYLGESLVSYLEDGEGEPYGE